GNSSISASTPEPGPLAIAIPKVSTTAARRVPIAAPGTGFLSPETEARKRAPAAPETHRDRNAKQKAPDVAAEMVFRQGKVEAVVSRERTRARTWDPLIKQWLLRPKRCIADQWNYGMHRRLDLESKLRSRI